MGDSEGIVVLHTIGKPVGTDGHTGMDVHMVIISNSCFQTYLVL